jgi:hypothetical protein
MTDTDTPRTTAPATQGDALTAEQARSFRLMEDEIDAALLHVESLQADNATLRDRLARAEERERELRVWANDNAGICRNEERNFAPGSSGWANWHSAYQTYILVLRRINDSGRQPESQPESLSRQIATPTDGAPPPWRDEEGRD